MCYMYITPVYCISPAIFDILGPKHYAKKFDLSRSRGVIDHFFHRFAVSHVLLLVHWNRASISNCFRDVGPQKSVCACDTYRQRHMLQVISYFSEFINKLSQVCFECVSVAAKHRSSVATPCWLSRPAFYFSKLTMLSS